MANLICFELNCKIESVIDDRDFTWIFAGLGYEFQRC